MQFRKKPHNLLLWFALVLVLASFIVNRNNATFDVTLHDSYFVISFTPIFYLLAILLFLVWAFYFSFQKLLYSKTLTWIHIVTTIITLTLFIALVLFEDLFSYELRERSYNYADRRSVSGYTILVAATFVALSSAQGLFFLNLLAGIFQKKNLKKQVDPLSND